MVGEVFLTREGLGAVTAAVGRFARVLANVIGKVFLAREGFGAVCAFVG